jgi:glyoxylate reductase
MITMKKTKIYVTRDQPGTALNELQNLYDVTINFEDHPVSKQVLIEQAAGLSGIIACVGDQIDGEVMDASGGSLQAVCNAIVGFDNVDLTAATKRGIYVTNTPGVLTETVADLTFGLILSVARNITSANRFIRTGNWHGWGPTQFLGIDVYGKTLGIVGLGRIGYAVARRAQGFNMKLLFYDVYRNPEREKQYGLTYASLDMLLQQSDYVTIHVPLVPQTRHFIGKQELDLMKDTAFLINTSRGPVVNEKDLIEALQAEKIRGAGLDVWDPEPPQANNPLLAMDNVVALPHIASASIETRSLMIQMAIDNLKCILQGKIPPNLVNKDVMNVRPLSSS